MAVPKKRVSKTRKNLRHTNWKRDLIPQALKALSFGKALGLRNKPALPNLGTSLLSVEDLPTN